MAAAFAAGAAAIVFLSALSPFADELLGPLERRYPPLVPGAVRRNVAFIVVLGSGYYPRPNFPITAVLNEEGLARIVEAVRLTRIYHRPLVVSGGASQGGSPSALGYAELARDLGIDPQAMIVSAVGMDTHMEAVALAGLVRSKPYILVTSASHMPRAVLLLRRAGTYPVPAPTAQHVFSPDPLGWHRWLPGALGLRKTEMALHEYLGLLAIQLGLD